MQCCIVKVNLLLSLLFNSQQSLNPLLEQVLCHLISYATRNFVLFFVEQEKKTICVSNFDKLLLILLFYSSMIHTILYVVHACLLVCFIYYHHSDLFFPVSSFLFINLNILVIIIMIGSRCLFSHVYYLANF